MIHGIISLFMKLFSILLVCTIEAFLERGDSRGRT